MKKRILIIALSGIVTLAIVGVLVWLFVSYLPERRKQEEWQRQMAAYYDSKLQQYATENAALGDTQVDVVFLGDSLTDGYDLDTYYPQYNVLNRGIGGDTTYGLYNRLDVSVYQVKPKVAVMLIGANNMHTMMDDYENLLQGFQTNMPDTKIVLLSLTSMTKEWGKNNQLAAYNNVLIRLLAQKYGYTFVDLYSPLLDPSTGELRQSYTTDGGHLTPAGYRVVTDTVTPYLQALLGK